MADSVYTAGLFGSPAGDQMQALTSDKSHSRNHEEPPLRDQFRTAQRALPLAELAIAHDFAVEQHSPATRKAYMSDFALFAGSGAELLPCGS